jgi:hypothetical protein
VHACKRRPSTSATRSANCLFHSLGAVHFNMVRNAG